ncbi:NME/NM23 family member 9 [Cricetulus griseus]
MSSRKKEMALQSEIVRLSLSSVPTLSPCTHVTTQSAFVLTTPPRAKEEREDEELMEVVDVYQGWCGPCKPVVSLFQKMRIEVGLDLLHFALGGKLVAVVKGANAPLLQKTILHQLEVEKKALGKGRERNVVTDEVLSGAAKCLPHEKDGGEDGDIVSLEKTCTLAIIKPDAVAHGKADEIIMKEAFEKLVHHMCSGPSHLLILTKTEGTEDVVTAWRTFLGPCDPNEARKEHPESLRAQYGTEMPFNAVHGSRDREDANRELALLFPSFKFSSKDKEAPQGSIDSHEFKGKGWDLMRAPSRVEATRGAINMLMSAQKDLQRTISENQCCWFSPIL